MGRASMNVAFLASHRGSSMQRVVDACRTAGLAARPCVVISNNGDAEALTRARRAGVPHYHLSRQTHPEPERLDAAIRDTLLHHEAELIALAGYLRPLGPLTLSRYRGRIVNIHPALL